MKYVADLAPAGKGERVALVARGRVFVAGLGPLRRVEVPMPEGARATAALSSSRAVGTLAPTALMCVPGASHSTIGLRM